jgi:hypothetical protein
MLRNAEKNKKLSAGMCGRSSHAAKSGWSLGGIFLRTLGGSPPPSNDFDRTAIDCTDFGHGEGLAQGTNGKQFPVSEV